MSPAPSKHLRGCSFSSYWKSLQQAPQLHRRLSASLKLNWPLASTILCFLQEIYENWPLTGTSPLLPAFNSLPLSRSESHLAFELKAKLLIYLLKGIPSGLYVISWAVYTHGKGKQWVINLLNWQSDRLLYWQLHFHFILMVNTGLIETSLVCLSRAARAVD